MSYSFYWIYNMKKIFLILIFTSFHLGLAGVPIEKRTTDMRIKMLNGEYGRLSDYVGNGLTIINFWTTW